MVEFTEGYPYFLQEYGNTLWNQVEESPVTAADVSLARTAVEAKLDGGFFRVRVERTSELEQRYLRAMAELGPEPQAAKDVATLARARLASRSARFAPA